MKLDLREFEWLGTFLGFTSGTYCIQSHLDLATALFSIPLQLHLPGNRKRFLYSEILNAHFLFIP